VYGNSQTMVYETPAAPPINVGSLFAGRFTQIISLASPSQPQCLSASYSSYYTIYPGRNEFIYQAKTYACSQPPDNMQQWLVSEAHGGNVYLQILITDTPNQ
jgi:hypothetical protein